MARERKVEDNKIPYNTRTKESSSVAKVFNCFVCSENLDNENLQLQ
jgi:hypothetical protein